jgi:hypothetical protein
LNLKIPAIKGAKPKSYMEGLKTGDILLFNEKPSSCPMAILDCLIKKCTCSKYSHAALVVVDPPWAPNLKGKFVWESSWHGTPDPQDSFVKFGVQLTPLTFYTEQYPGQVSIWVREGNSNFFGADTLIRIHKMVYRHKYDDRPKDWCAALFKKPIPRQTDVFTCSAFVSFILTSVGVLSLKTPWTIITAAELSCKCSMLEWQVEYGNERHLGDYNNARNVHKHYTEI